VQPPQVKGQREGGGGSTYTPEGETWPLIGTSMHPKNRLKCPIDIPCSSAWPLTLLTSTGRKSQQQTVEKGVRAENAWREGRRNAPNGSHGKQGNQQFHGQYNVQYKSHLSIQPSAVHCVMYAVLVHHFAVVRTCHSLFASNCVACSRAKHEAPWFSRYRKRAARHMVAYRQAPCLLALLPHVPSSCRWL
jgi:hypothetical protein